jgi:hypothetical protein
MLAFSTDDDAPLTGVYAISILILNISPRKILDIMKPPDEGISGETSPKRPDMRRDHNQS